MPAQNQLPRRTLEELIAIHGVERDIHDVIVEGPSDRNILEWFLIENKRANFNVYEVELFQIEPEDVLALGFEDNNKGRVLTVAYTAAANCHRKARITCVADRDLDKVLNKEHNCRYLLITDYACMIMYTFNVRVLTKYMRFRLRRFKKSARQVIQEISEALQILFAVRFAKHVLQLGLEDVEWKDCCSLERNGVELNWDEYLERCLNKNVRHRLKAQIATQIQECRRVMRFDPRFQIRGHDFIPMLIWYVSKHRGF